MAILTPTAIEGYKQYTNSVINSARYRIGSTYYNAPITRRERLPDGSVAVYFSIEPGISGNVTIVEVQLLDTNNNLWAAKPESIVINGLQKGVLYRFTFNFTEV